MPSFIPAGVITSQVTPIVLKTQADLAAAQAEAKRRNLLLIIAAVAAFLFLGRAGRGRRSW